MKSYVYHVSGRSFNTNLAWEEILPASQGSIMLSRPGNTRSMGTYCCELRCMSSVCMDL